MKNRYLFFFLMFVPMSFSLLSFLPLVNASESMTLNPIADKCVSNIGGGEEYLTVRYEEGLKWLSFFAFNLSEIQGGSSIDSAVLKIKTQFVIDAVWVSAYSSSNADWVQTGMSWDTKPEVDESIDAEWVSTHEEWYTWESSFFTDDVSDAFQETGELTVMLRSGFLVDQIGHIIFYPDAKLEVNYTLETLPPVIADIIRKPNSPTPDDEVKINASVTDSESGVKEVNLLYSIDGGVNWIKVTMSQVEDSVCTGIIPRQDQGTNVQYHAQAFDNAGNRKDSSMYSYTVRTEEEQKTLDLSKIPLWAVVVAVFILFGLPIIGVIAVIYFVKRRRKAKEPTVSARFDKFLRSNLISNIG